ncbi:F-box-like domain superfamily [Arabidopsis suecica]|uniref:F-box-like domain superfamily n=1 Tax=Arabidopsis suecica TaxID=45249 RepID=A0A8T2BN00_ARASU|nr:F-box-like domain superfamily [Arabidopsis suecica]
MIPNWSQLPEELLHLISKNLENCFDVVHAQSVCRSLVYTQEDPIFPLDRNTAANAASPSEYFLGGIDQDTIELPSPFQCSVKVKIPQSDPILVNMLDCQTLPMGYQYIMIGWDPESLATCYVGVAFLPLNKNGGEEFVVLLDYCNHLLVLKSVEMGWIRVRKTSIASCKGLVPFRGRFYYLIPSSNDELFLAEQLNPFPEADILDFSRFTCRVSRLDEEAGKWVEVTDLGPRVLFVGHFGNVCCSAKDLRDGCGVRGNSILFTNEPRNVTFAYKYGVHTGQAENELNIWRFSREIRVMIANTFVVVALRLECQAENRKVN